jgi:RHS repeat-associated protein
VTGNLLKRTDHLNNFYETFQYDNFDRLTEYRIFDNTNQNQLSLVEMRYSENGNIEYKSNFGEYSYLDQKPNAVESVLPDNQTVFEFTQTIEYNSFNKLRHIKDTIGTDEIEAEILYGADGHRRVMYEYVNGVKVKTTYYSGGYEEIVDNTTQETTRLHYISGNEGLTSVYEIDNTNTGMHYFVCKDHLGSITALIDENGVVVEERSYDPWGNPRKPDNWLNYNVPFFSITNRGYTGHEHLLQFGLINMNGRMYDPLLARMLSPDPFVTNPALSQDYNRYSYVRNNPLKYTDPSGYNPNEKRYRHYNYVPVGTSDLTWNSFIDSFDFSDYWNKLWGDNLNDGSSLGSPSATNTSGYTAGSSGGSLSNPIPNIIKFIKNLFSQRQHKYQRRVPAGDWSNDGRHSMIRINTNGNRSYWSVQPQHINSDSKLTNISYEALRPCLFCPGAASMDVLVGDDYEYLFNSINFQTAPDPFTTRPGLYGTSALFINLGQIFMPPLAFVTMYLFYLNPAIVFSMYIVGNIQYLTLHPRYRHVKKVRVTTWNSEITDVNYRVRNWTPYGIGQRPWWHRHVYGPNIQ